MNLPYWYTRSVVTWYRCRLWFLYVSTNTHCTRVILPTVEAPRFATEKPQCVHQVIIIGSATISSTAVCIAAAHRCVMERTSLIVRGSIPFHHTPSPLPTRLPYDARVQSRVYAASPSSRAHIIVRFVEQRRCSISVDVLPFAGTSSVLCLLFFPLPLPLHNWFTFITPLDGVFSSSLLSLLSTYRFTTYPATQGTVKLVVVDVPYFFMLLHLRTPVPHIRQLVAYVCQFFYDYFCVFLLPVFASLRLLHFYSTYPLLAVHLL